MSARWAAMPARTTAMGPALRAASAAARSATLAVQQHRRRHRSRRRVCRRQFVHNRAGHNGDGKGRRLGDRARPNRRGVRSSAALRHRRPGADADSKVSVSGSGITLSDTKTQTGWTAGAGVEWMFLPRWSLKAEYLYRRFESVTLFGGISTGSSALNSGQFGVNYHF